jgi:hypothetical protein
MSVYMYDGVNSLAPGIARQFPDAVKVAGYISGPYAWSQADWDLFPHADHVTIATMATVNAGDVLDVEAGDATPGQSAGWIAMRKAAGLYRPTVYCSRSVIPAVRAGTGAFVLGRDYDIWVADYDDSLASVYPLAVAKQYRSTSQYDVSVVYDAGWPHRKPPGAPVPPPPPVGPVWPAGVTLREGDSGGAVRVLQAALRGSGVYGARGLSPVDGVFGAHTLAAVRAFQHGVHLLVDGVAGPATRTALLG